jgi:hypothetical protein
LLGGHVAQQDTRASISEANYQFESFAVRNVHVKLIRTPADVSFSNSPSNPEEPVSNKLHYITADYNRQTSHLRIIRRRFLGQSGSCLLQPSLQGNQKLMATTQ